MGICGTLEKGANTMSAASVALAQSEPEPEDEQKTEKRVPRPVSLVKLPHLRAWRIKKLRTQLDVAASAGLGISTIVRAEKGGDVGALTAERLARALELSVRQLKEEAPED
jgi:DNA-binding XRE family transcriptional regulator